MRALICKEYGPPETLVLGELPSPPLGAKDVRIRVRACGVNFPDLLIIQNKYQVKPQLPFAPGGEVAGEVLEVGSEVRRIRPGDKVMALTGYGGFAEEVVVDEHRVLPMPAGMDFVTAAGFTMVYGTTYHALVQRASIQAAETLVVLGAAGGVGLAAVELGKVFGARVIACAGSEEKLRTAREHGADELVDYRREDLKERIKALTDGKGADVCFDPVGGDAFDAMARSMNWNGRLLVIGFASGRIPQLPVNLPLLKGYQVVGVFWGAFVAREPETNRRNFAHLFELYAAGRIRPHVSHTYPLEQAARALDDLSARRAIGKIVVTIE
ncbi:NADPH:quinone oxidoreductase family protein [Tepidiphilus olei]|uniref:NADPH:quinone oxidoreductase family protein n=1 Tax=Tepidiphilus olei TaxID=2502184 RepID=UPI00115DDAB4|nr:NADPH:quinone oxidoreductase family protein [Tepidiphilus olei]